MALWQARSTPAACGTGWACAAAIALWVTLATLVHHDIASPPFITRPLSMPHSMHGMPHVTPEPTAAPEKRTPAARDVPTGLSAAEPSGGAGSGRETRAGSGAAPGLDHGVCSFAGTQHCSSASLDTVQLAPLPTSRVERGCDLRSPGDGTEASRTISRAPPDLSVLSRLRI